MKKLTDIVRQLVGGNAMNTTEWKAKIYTSQILFCCSPSSSSLCQSPLPQNIPSPNHPPRTAFLALFYSLSSNHFKCFCSILPWHWLTCNSFIIPFRIFSLLHAFQISHLPCLYFAVHLFIYGPTFVTILLFLFCQIFLINMLFSEFISASSLSFLRNFTSHHHISLPLSLLLTNLISIENPT